MTLIDNPAWEIEPESIYINHPISLDTFDKAVEFYRQNNYAMTFHLLNPIAKQYDNIELQAKAVAWIGYMHWTGNGCPIATKKAIEYFNFAHTHGNFEGSFWLSGVYYEGYEQNGIQKDYKKSYDIAKIAADKGSALCQFRIGIMHYLGQGVYQSNDEAFKWATLSADQKDSKGQHFLADLYLKGVGTPQNIDKAFDILNNSAMQGDQEGQVNVALIFFEGKYITKSYSKAKHWASLAAEKGNSIAIQLLKDIEKNSPSYYQEKEDASAKELIEAVDKKRSRGDNIDEEHTTTGNKKIKQQTSIEIHVE